MSYTKPESFITGEYYHIYNRGVEKRKIFDNESDYKRFRSSLRDFNSTDPAWKIEWAKEKGEITEGEALVEVIAYCFNSNHYHLLLKQVRNDGVSDFMRKIGTGHTMYFNKKYDRSGVLFQGKFKSVHVKNNNHLLYLSAYVNCNSEIHKIAKAEEYKWCSFGEYLSLDKILCNKEIILSQFRDTEEYKNFCKENALEIMERREFEKSSLE
ncbi:MAG: transposase [Candidatus Moranbacteria bacterium]|nr:transposase [Candidatus Moranbacteria bacterium]